VLEFSEMEVVLDPDGGRFTAHGMAPDLRLPEGLAGVGGRLEGVLLQAGEHLLTGMALRRG
jgi:hypothetical protein